MSVVKFSGATLIFDVELINIGNAPPTTNVFKEIDDDQDNQLSREEVSKMARSIFIPSFGNSWYLGIIKFGKE